VEDLVAVWCALLARHTASPDVEATGRALLARWCEPHRRYHDIAHLRGILGYVDQLADYAGDADAVRLAAWYHDAVYDGLPDDEERSAQTAEAELALLGLPGAVVAEVARLVRMTVTHDPACGDRDGEVLSDADLATLALPAEDYQRNSVAIRAEYAHVPEDTFRAARARMIEALLAEPQLFRTPMARQRWEAAARTNLREELVTLTLD
jgi:predicted metal-dependent HD superfamily phosphohydrolase